MHRPIGGKQQLLWSPLQDWLFYRDVVSVSTYRSRHGPETHQHLVSSQLFTSCTQDVIFDQIVQATLIEW